MNKIKSQISHVKNCFIQEESSTSFMDDHVYLVWSPVGWIILVDGLPFRLKDKKEQFSITNSNKFPRIEQQNTKNLVKNLPTYHFGKFATTSDCSDVKQRLLHHNEVCKLRASCGFPVDDNLFRKIWRQVTKRQTFL